ncbi:hypothetical protein ANN_02780 [Periplaneta americana]|uniref:Mariner Mos1 transposase n=1 Tax=Periplaneta americana TaxID=6978 RepID=A0ABQ8TX88_PERAM|nr:hypothetical protein ANN_02780 [Periplaneta americana]
MVFGESRFCRPLPTRRRDLMLGEQTVVIHDYGQYTTFTYNESATQITNYIFPPKVVKTATVIIIKETSLRDSLWRTKVDQLTASLTSTFLSKRTTIPPVKRIIDNESYDISPFNEFNFLPVRKVMATLFFDSEGFLLVDIIPHGTTINSDAYVATLKKLQARMSRVRPHPEKQDVLLLHDNARSHVSHKTTDQIRKLG